MYTHNYGRNGLLSVNFNQDQGCFACGMDNGFRIYNTDPLKQKQRFDTTGGIGGFGWIEMLYRCNYLALIPHSNNSKYSTKQVIVWDDVAKQVTFKLTFDREVYAVRMRRDRLVVVLDQYVHIYSFSVKPEVLKVFESAYNNRRGLCAVSAQMERAYAAFPARKCGMISVVDLRSDEMTRRDFPAHETRISCLSMNESGQLLATASEKGTLIRIFDVDARVMIHELRRGAHQAVIYSIAFNRDNSMLCASSDHGTVHVFDLTQTKNRLSVGGGTSPGGRETTGAAAFLPKYFLSHTSCVRFEIPHAAAPCAVAFGAQTNTLVAVSSSGTCYKFSFRPHGNYNNYNREFCAHFLEMTDSEGHSTFNGSL